MALGYSSHMDNGMRILISPFSTTISCGCSGFGFTRIGNSTKSDAFFASFFAQLQNVCGIIPFSLA
jgi:hypothetical protein